VAASFFPLGRIGSVESIGHRRADKISQDAVCNPAQREEARGHELITRNGPDTITWQSKDRTLDGKALPDVRKSR